MEILPSVSGNQPNTILNKDFFFKSKSQQFLDFCSAFGFVGFSFSKIVWNPILQKKDFEYVWQITGWSELTKTKLRHSNDKGFSVVTGKVSGITGIDCDTQETYHNLTRHFPQLLNSLTVKTRKGYHIYCKYDERVPNGVQTFVDFPDIDIRNDQGQLFVPPSQYVMNGEVYGYEFVNFNQPVTFPEELILNINHDKVVKHKNKKPKNTYLKFSQSNPIQKVVNEYQKLLDQLDPVYFNDTTLWSNVGAALHWSCDCKAFFDLWVKFSKKSKLYKMTEQQFKYRWMSFDRTVAKAKTTGTLKFYHQESKNHAKTHINYNLMNLPFSYDPFKDVNSIPNINITKVKREFVWDFINPNRNVLPAKGRIHALKFDTGQGKTTGAKEYRARLGNPPLIITTPRVVVAKQLSSYFNIQFYQNMKTHGVNEAIQLDSLHKLKQIPNESFMMFLDEFDQVAEHFLSPTMAYLRLHNLKRFADLINKADHVVIADANLSIRSLRFLRNITSKHIDLFVNEKVTQRDQEVCFYPDLNSIRNQLVTAIQNNHKVYFCSDRLDQFEEHVVAPIRAMFPKKKFIFHSSEDKHLDVLDDVTVHWQLFDGVAATPTVTSGIDYNPKVNNKSIRTHAVFAFYFGGNIDALKHNQQINRIRNPTEINIWCSSGNDQNMFSLESTKKNIISLAQCTNAKKLVHDSENQRFTDVLVQLHADSQYLNQCLSNHVQFHLVELIKAKGYSNISEIVADDHVLVPAEFLTKQFYMNYRKNKINTDLHDLFYRLQEKYPNLEPSVIDDLLVHRTLAITAERYFQFEIDKTKKQRFDDVVSAAYSIENQHRLCLKLTKKLGLNWLKFNFDQDLKHVLPATTVFVSDQLINEIFGVFQIHHKPAKVKDGRKFKHSFANLYQLLMRMIQHVYPKMICLYKGVEDSSLTKKKVTMKKSLLAFNSDIVETLISGL